MNDWLGNLAEALGEPALGSEETGAVLRLAREVAHGVERKLEPEMLVIADATHAQAVAGVMGGRSSEVSVDTRTVAFERTTRPRWRETSGSSSTLARSITARRSGSMARWSPGTRGAIPLSRQRLPR